MGIWLNVCTLYFKTGPKTRQMMATLLQTQGLGGCIVSGFKVV